MESLIGDINELKSSPISQLISERISEFETQFKKGIDAIFKELCFCIMTANCAAEKCIEIHDRVGNSFLSCCEEELRTQFKEYGYRFPNVRSKFIIEARVLKEELEEQLIKYSLGTQELRNWIVKNIKGLGYKEASHFLRNIGYKNYAIIDFHIVDVLEKYGLIEKPKTMTKRAYLEIEKVLSDLGTELNLNMAELDLYLWYLETGKVLK
jgi:N-glycosylase/DNA lyase